MSLVTCKFEGRLCNNIIQVMAMIGYSKKYNAPWFLPRQYHHRDIFRFGLPLIRGPKRYPFHEDPWSDKIGFQEIPYYDKGVTLHGFFQSEKYFLHAREDILQAFHRLHNHNMIRDNLSGATFIHVRRGDYLEYPTRFHSVPLEYIGNAVEEIRAKGFNRFKVFSDDILWCKQNFNFSGNFEYSENRDAIEDLTEMGHCSNAIICASTFGWVPAWLNTNPDKIVIAPKKWFEWETTLTDKDIIPESWIRI